MMPKEYPNWSTVYGYYWKWRKGGVWEQMNARLVKKVRVKNGRKEQPSAAVLYSQSVKTSEDGEERGVDVHKQTNGRKGHVLVDVLGLILIVKVTSASVQDAAGALLLLQCHFDLVKRSVYNRWCRLKLIWADGAYASKTEEICKRFGWQLSVVSRPVNLKVGLPFLIVGSLNALLDGWVDTDDLRLITNTPFVPVSLWFALLHPGECFAWLSIFDLKNTL